MGDAFGGIASEKAFHGLLGSGVLAIWSSIELDNDMEYNDWYTHQHLPERVGIPGFLRGRRYVGTQADDARLQYFALYETENVGVLASAAYLERLNHPSDWTTQVLPLFRNGSRTAGIVTATLGQGIGGCAATLEFGPEPGTSASLRQWLVDEALPRAISDRGMVAIHLCESDSGVTEAKARTEESKSVTAASESMARWFILIEAMDDRTANAISSDLVSAEGLVRHGASSNVKLAQYHLIVSLSE